MFSRRRLTLQLTPLLDLLLIIMFSQYMENKEKTLAVEEQLSAQQTAVESELARRKLAIEHQFAEDRKTLEELRQVYEERFRGLANQHTQIGALLADSLNLPEAALNEILRLRSANSPGDAERLIAATQSLQELMHARGDEVFRFLTQIDQMQKHVTIWEVHVQDNGQVLISDTEQSFTTDFSTEAEFSSRLFEASKSFAAPRTLVIILLSWGDAQGGSRQRATNGMPLLTEQLRRDAAGTRWYDFSILGFRAKGPITKPAGPQQP